MLAKAEVPVWAACRRRERRILVFALNALIGGEMESTLLGLIAAKQTGRTLARVSLLCCFASGGFAQNGPTTTLPVTPGPRLPVVTFADNGQVGSGDAAEILSDTRGVDFQPYLKQILGQIYGQWIRFIPEKARKPTLAKGETEIRFTILPNGQIGAMHLDASTHDTEMNKAAWGAITSVKQYPQLPASFTGPDLELRVHFRVNLPAVSAR